jgi:hypothetical protein
MRQESKRERGEGIDSPAAPFPVEGLTARERKLVHWMFVEFLKMECRAERAEAASAGSS